MRSDHLPAPSGKLIEIEYLRAFAVTGVMIQHARGNLLPDQNRFLTTLTRHADLSTGVDLFFAISGFVIARSLLPALAETGVAAGFWQVTLTFWKRRVWRLLPSAWLWLLIILIASALFNRLGLFGTVRTNAWAMLAGMFDFANLRLADLYLRFPYGASFAWWSLSLEEQFYLVLPPLVFLCGRFLPLLLVPVILYQFQMRRTLLPMLLRTDAIALGVLLACWAGRFGLPWAGATLSRIPSVLKPWLTACLLLGLVTHSHDVEPYGVGLIAIFSVGLVYLASLDCGFVLGASKIRPIFAWVGARSYALYLIHIPAFFFAREVWFRLSGSANYAAILSIAVVTLVICAECNWRLIEQPIRRRYLSQPFGKVTAARP